MKKSNNITFQFISEPSDVNYGGKVHGGVVMKWIDQTAFACACNWSESYSVTVYVGGIRFYKPINIGSLVKINAKVVHTGNTSMHIIVDVYSKLINDKKYEKKTHCVVVFVALDDNGNPTPVEKWQATTKQEIENEKYVIKLKELRAKIDDEMKIYTN
jgi:acyl-CoA hydrolase